MALVATLILVASVVTTLGGDGRQWTRLDEASLREAIAFGETHDPGPYLLYQKAYGPADPDEPREPTMAVYTPFVRVALAARTARECGHALRADTLPEWIVKPDILVVVRPPSRTSGMSSRLFPDDPPLDQTPITQIALMRRGQPQFLDFIAPASMTRDLSFLTALGGLPFPDAVGAATFDPKLFLLDVDIYGWWRKGNDYLPSHGMLDPEEMKTWR